jgi:hypothetical protein
MSTTRTTDGTNYTLSILCSQSNEKKRNCNQATGVWVGRKNFLGGAIPQ